MYFNYFFKSDPTVFIVGEFYYVMIPVEKSSLMYVRVADSCFYDEFNGILRSSVQIHRVKIPKNTLETEKKYTICVREVIERQPYFSETGELFEFEFEFAPVKSGDIALYHISDSHNHIDEAIKAEYEYEKKYGKIDFLILNGDITNYIDAIEDYNNIYRLTGEITHGKIPVVFSRGNHDTRGIMSEKMEEYMPNDNGKNYFSFKIGDLWGLVLDCGEDKNDTNVEYGNTICCHEFRLRQTEFIKEIVNDCQTEYCADGINKKILICHIPFMMKKKPPFDIEKPIYEEWSEILKEHIKPDIAICGHKHELSFELPDAENGYPCPVIVAAKPVIANEDKKESAFIGTGMCLKDGSIDIKCNDSFGNIVFKQKFDLNIQGE